MYKCLSLVFCFVLILLQGCSLPSPGLRESSQITEGNDQVIPHGMVDWCNTLTTEQFYDEPECMWYCRVYFKNEYTRNELIKHAKAEVNSCEKP